MTGLLHPPMSAVREAVARALNEDLTPLGDLTSALVPPELMATGDLVARTEGVLAGRWCAEETFRQVDPAIVVDWKADDGDLLPANHLFGEVSGPLASMLTAERTALNFLGHLSGIATLTRRFVETARARGGTARVWDTRKTTPGLRALEKAAVRAGGGTNHRGNLSDWVLLKDNHLQLWGITEAVHRARERWPGRTVQVECVSIDEVKEALSAGANALLLDNMSPDQVRAAVDVVTAAPGDRPLLEASGGVSLETIADYAECGVDLISVGALTNSAPVLDIALDVRPADRAF